MHKSVQITLIVLSIAIIAGLYTLPKVVVKNPDDTDAATVALEDAKQLEDEMHTKSLTKEQSQIVTQWKANLAEAETQDSKIAWLDSIALFYKNISWFDSSAHYKGIIALEQNTIQNQMQAGNAYYDAFSFALDAKKASQMGEKARGYFQKVLENEPQNLEAKTKLGMTYVTTQNPMQGINLLLEVVEKDPKNELALYNLGLLSMQRNAPDKAIARFEALLEAHPNNLEARVLLAQNYEAEGKIDKAIALLEETKKMDLPDDYKEKLEGYLNTLKQK